MTGPFVLFESPNLVELMGHARFDFVVIDFMHTSFSAATVENLIRAADAVQIPALVRVPPHDPRALEQCLEAGAAGLVIPHLGSTLDAADVVRAAKFPPIGGRGACPSVRAAGFQTQNELEYQRSANSNTLLIGLVESIEAVNNASDLVAFPELDAFLIGPYDLSTSMGLPGEIRHPSVTAAADGFIRKALEAGRRVGVHLFDASDVDRWTDAGATFFTLSLTGLILQSSQSAIQRIRGKAVTVQGRPT